MNNGNSSKQVLLSVLGIAVLVIAVVGVSFAFFTYSSTGKNQLLTTGSIFFQFLDGDEITLTNQFPVPDSTGLAYSKQDGAKDVMSFSIKGHTTGDPIPFKIKAVPGDKPESLDGVADIGTRDLLEDEDIKINLKETTSTASLTQNYASGATKVSTLGSLASGIVLAEGQIDAADGADETDTFELRMWISNDVTFGNGQGDKYTGDEFASKYYALKIQVVAGDAAA